MLTGLFKVVNVPFVDDLSKYVGLASKKAEEQKEYFTGPLGNDVFQLASAGPTTYQLQLIHGYNRGTSLRSMIHDWYQYDPKVKRIMPGDNPGITVLVLKELY